MNVVKEKSINFAVRIVNLYTFLCKEKNEYVMSKQILRSSTSIGANIAESEYAISKSDFISKLYIALKETSETLYWLEILYKTYYLSETEYSSLYTDCEEIRKILSSSTKTLKE
ncbi:MAG: four helix bundle protein [Eubacteriales bacterium]|nr:four helix bundle protein [Eubacteriales bacterium]